MCGGRSELHWLTPRFRINSKPLRFIILGSESCTGSESMSISKILANQAKPRSVLENLDPARLRSLERWRDLRRNRRPPHPPPAAFLPQIRRASTKDRIPGVQPQLRARIPVSSTGQSQHPSALFLPLRIAKTLHSCLRAVVV